MTNRPSGAALMTRAELVWAWMSAAGGGLIIAALLIRGAAQGTLLLFAPYADGPSWATVGLAVMASISAAQLVQHYRRGTAE